MLAAAFPPNEAERIEAIKRAQILDTPPEERFDRLTRLARRLFGVPMALVSVVDADRQWFKSAQGLATRQTPRKVSFCAHAILGDELFIVRDALADERFSDNPLVTENPKIRFYAGCPLSLAGGHKLGALCLLDVEPRELSADEQELLRDLAGMAEQELAAHRLATTDELTQMCNRRGFENLAQSALDACFIRQEPATLCFFDLNRFKAINDAFGHAAGDAALRAFGRALKEAVGDAGLAARLGGDEFVALMPGATEREAFQALDRLRAALDRENRSLSQRGFSVGFSVGRIETPADPRASEPVSLAALLSQADAAMYASKKARHEALSED